MTSNRTEINKLSSEQQHQDGEVRDETYGTVGKLEANNAYQKALEETLTKLEGEESESETKLHLLCTGRWHRLLQTKPRPDHRWKRSGVRYERDSVFGSLLCCPEEKQIQHFCSSCSLLLF